MECQKIINLLGDITNQPSKFRTKNSDEINDKIKLHRCVGSCNNLNDLSNKVCVPNKIEDLNLSMFNMITGINESKTLTNQISCKCRCKSDGRKCNSDQWWNNKQ